MSNGKCVVCKTPLQEEKSSRYYGDPMHAIIGPGHSNQMTVTCYLFCPECGIEYYRPPRTKKASNG